MARDDHIHARRGGMQTIVLIETAVTGNAVKKERVEQDAVLGRKLGIDRLEGSREVGAEIGRRAHAAKKDRDMAVLQALQNRIERARA